jgi:glycosyltransferase involved in cell wall biosynthesis
VSRKLRDELRDSLGISTDSLIILSVGFVIRRKGYEELLSLLSEVDLDFYIYLVGEFRFHRDHFLSAHSEDTDQIVAYGKKVLGDKLVFTGPVNRVNDYLQLADIFILNSRQEGMPNVLLEAMACGCAVLCRDLPGFSGYVLDHGKTGLIYRDNEELKSEILRLGTHPEVREELGRNAAEFISGIASFGIVWKQLLLLLNKSQ